jgi:hypothetical protein
MFPLALAVLFFIYTDVEVMVLLRSFFDISSGNCKISLNLEDLVLLSLRMESEYPCTSLRIRL